MTGKKQEQNQKKNSGGGGGKRDLPISNLDAEMMTTNPVWGREVPEELYQELKEKWGQLGFYTRDLRLGNLQKDQEKIANYYLNLAGDCLDWKLIDSFMKCLRHVISMTELSQSRKMALRQIMNTLRYENFQGKNPDEEEKDTKFGIGRKKS